MDISRKPLYIAPSRTSGNRRASLSDGHTLYIYTDVIDDQIAGNSNAMLMCVFLIKVTHGEQQSWQLNPFPFIDIPRSTVASIRMRICTPSGEEVPFLSAQNHCRLHFHRKMQ